MLRCFVTLGYVRRQTSENLVILSLLNVTENEAKFSFKACSQIQSEQVSNLPIHT